MYNVIATLEWHKQCIWNQVLFCFLIAQNMWKSLALTDSEFIQLAHMTTKWHIFKPIVFWNEPSWTKCLLCVVCSSSSCTQRPACPLMLCGYWPRQCAWSLPLCGRWWSRGMCCNMLLWRSLWLRPVRPSQGSWPPDIRASWPWGSGDGWVCTAGSHEHLSLNPFSLQLLIEGTLKTPKRIALRFQIKKFKKTHKRRSTIGLSNASSIQRSHISDIIKAHNVIVQM